MRYRLIQFCDDPPRAEYRNFGLIVENGKEAVCRTLWKQYRTNNDSTNFMGFFTRSDTSEIPLFAEWEHWLQSLVIECKGNMDALHEELDRLDDPMSKFSAHEIGEIESNESDSLIRIAEWLENRLLYNPWGFKEAVFSILQSTELTEYDHYQGSVWLELPEAGKLFFPHVLNNETWLGIKTLTFRYQSDAEVIIATNEIFYTFEALEKYHPDKNMIVLADHPIGEHISIFKRLSRRMEVIDITLKHAESRLRQLVYMD